MESISMKHSSKINGKIHAILLCVVAVLVILIAGFVGFFVVSLNALSPHSLCTTDFLKSSLSPDLMSRVSIYKYDCGAAARIEYSLALMQSGREVQLFRTTSPRFESSFNVTWLTAKSIHLEFQHCPSVNSALEVGGVEVHISSQCPSDSAGDHSASSSPFHSGV